MAWTQSDLDSLDKAIRSGALTVRRADGSQVQYRSLDEMLRIRAEMQAAVAPSSTTNQPVTGYASHSRD